MQRLVCCDPLGMYFPQLNRATVMLAMAAMADPKANAAEVARRLNITTTTLYAHVNGDGTLKQAGQALLIET